MSLFSVQFSSQGANQCLEQKCCAPTRIYQPCQAKSILLDRCNKKDCGKAKEVVEPCERRCKSTQTAIVNGERVLRPWASSTHCDPCRPETPPPCTEKEECHNKKSKIIEARATDCGSVIVKLLVNGGPDQHLVMFVDLPQCEKECDEVAFNARSLSVGEGKCITRCQVPCEFAVFCINRKKSTPSGVFINLNFVSAHAPSALFDHVGPCCCYVPFCFEFEVWRRCAEPCCLEVETVLPERPSPSRCATCATCGNDDCGCSDC